MLVFDEKSKSSLERGEYYLVQCPGFCPSGFEIAEWDGKNFISQANSDEMNNEVEGFLHTYKIAQV